MSEIFIGIDLGTTNTLACYLKNGRPDFIRFAGKTLLPEERQTRTDSLFRKDAFAFGDLRR